ncbi:MAG: NADH-quinone oxidoreductase subunit K [Candidatus Thiodiazotropha sp. (ex Lucina aurantia)]|uniref:Putative monovalent cation/H+ antiporter subunit C n=1 Tax=Candidatus Thiodiazotropha endolucinida TaxID=1655433 RepID=A0A7Z0VMT8_9GAMM|nr:NADH-quinone oxidoreductase subunit K [Candidatus Thiodiazotropha endolucinida]MBT3012768.1 NADH-quinone oxidoreductase subunit K [Candidatus Thiodiazotropha sp. (ex Lucina pensylvanica)]MBT3014856.1 NADH-quinone oxidoreductase subunit K [Candidatus Thiodiazotropha taylori]MBT3039595.1 NADH-quinone oxidoreductase subunit K [Candidatus Thiodiazotropha sp. (ex Codakia orbicularis)]MBV2103656.1 NADH-quinone oxidoreductase subunit K [Candidatus Thiodiazotropha sp. (ex Lucina aurantia)]MBT302412
MTQALIYALTGAVLFMLGVRSTLLRDSLLARILGLNVSGAGIFLIFVSLAYRGDSMPTDPIPHALVLTGLVVAISATALALALNRRLREMDDE